MPDAPNAAPGGPAAAANDAAAGLDREFLALLRCPACNDRPAVHLTDAADALVCEKCGRRYPIVDGLPSLLVEAAETPSPTSTT